MRWRVGLHEQAVGWVKELAATDPTASSWVAAAIDLLHNGPPPRRCIRIPCEQEPPRRLRPVLGMKCTRKVRIWYSQHPRQRAIYVVRGELTGSPADDSCVITYKPLQWPPRRDRQARKLVNLVVNILPTSHRARYAEELQAELAMLSDRRQTMIVYALRLVARSWLLRRALMGTPEPATATQREQ